MILRSVYYCGNAVTILFIALALPACAADTAPSVPAEYQALYNSMQSSISAFDQSILAKWDTSKPPVAFSAHALSANSILGEQLLDPNQLTAVGLELDGFKAMGQGAMSLSIDYPTLDPAFDPYGGHSAAYLDFYKKVVAAARSRGLKVIVETGPLFSDPLLSRVNVMPFYQMLSSGSYRAGRANHALLIAQQLAPDYLSVVQEPDTEAAQTGKPEFGTPSGSASLLTQILLTYRNGGATGSIGAGVGTWVPGWSDYIRSFTSTSVDFIDIHIYPSNRNFLQRAITIADMAHAAGKKVGVSECWSHKVADAELGVLSDSAAFARDMFSFWAPVDSLFLKTMTDFAFSQKVDFLAAFQSRCLRGYVDYTPATAALSSTDLNALAVQIQSVAMQSGTFTSTAHDWESYLVGMPDVAAPAMPGTLSLTASSNSARLTWGASADNIGTAGYRLFRDGQQIGQTALLIYGDFGLKDGVTYAYSVSAFDLSGNTSSAAASTIQTRDSTPPTVPANLTAVVSGKNIDLQWTASSDNVKVQAYRVSRAMNGGPLSLVAGVTAPSTDWTDRTVQSRASYCYTVTAVDTSAMASSPSAQSCVKAADVTAPTVPANVMATAQSASQVNVAWNASTDDVAVTAYKVYRSDGGGAAKLLPESPTTNSLADRSLAAKTSYSYRISACDAAGNCSAQSAAATVTTPALPDTTPPKVSIISPAPGSKVSGIISITATASDAAGIGQVAGKVAGVRLQLDGLDVSSELTSPPYSVRYNTKSLPKSSHTVKAIARDAAGNAATSAVVTFTVN